MNKFMVRLFAVVLSVMMLGTVAFAATAELDGSAIAGSEFEEGYTDNTVKTVLAYKATSADDTTYTAEDIIALDQAADVASIAINEADVDDAAFIVVLYGGNAGITDKAVINLSGVEEFEVIECATEITLVDGPYTKTYTNVAVAKKTFAVPAGKTVTEYGVNWVRNGILTDYKASTVTETLFEGAGNLDFGVVMYGVPSDVVIAAKPFITFAD